MSIRYRLLFFFGATLALMSGIGFYAAYTYRASVSDAETVREATRRTVEVARAAQSSFRSELASWKNVLLRGTEVGQYHEHLSKFYTAERQTRDAIEQLVLLSADESEINESMRQLLDEHQTLGRRLREAIRVYNATEEEPHVVADQFSGAIEISLSKLLDEVVAQAQERKDEQLRRLDITLTERERVLAVLVVGLIIVSVALFLWLVDKNVGRPANRAAYLAEVINNAERAAQFGTWDWESQGDRYYWSEGMHRILGFDQGQEPSYDAFLRAVHSSDRDRLKETIDAARHENLPYEIEYRVLQATGAERMVQERGQVVTAKPDRGIRMTGIVYDITERKRAEQKLARLANYDILTGLPNRYLFQDRLKHAVAQADRLGWRVALLFLDLDRFKSINDALGHGVGDFLLKEVADRLRRAVRKGDTIARLGGDEFTIILENANSSSHVASVAEHVIEKLRVGFTIEGKELFVTASIGITFYPTDGLNLDTLLKNADTAMYRAKERGRNSYYFFTKELNRLAQERLSLESSLRGALARDEFKLYFQPQISLGKGCVIGAEALLRWMPEGGPLSPGQFVPVLEETGLIVPVGQWVLEQACRAARTWHEHGLKDFRVSVNLAARQLHDTDIISAINETLTKTRLKPENLEIEITESTLLEERGGSTVLENLRAIGVRLAIDDFGTGYSSLSYLKRFAVDTLKIDRSFVMDITRDVDDDAVTSAIIALAHNLEIQVTAEGVETAEQLEFLKSRKCDMIQGYLINRPVPHAEFERWVLSQPRRGGCHCWSAPDAKVGLMRDLSV